MMDEHTKKKRQLKEVFDSLDVNHVNSISINELSDFLRIQGTPEDKITEIMKEADADGSGTMDFDEFYNLMTNGLQQTGNESVEDYVDVFKVFDKYNTGKIRFDEVKEVMFKFEESLTMEEFENLFEDCVIIDGLIDYQDFIDTMLKKASNKNDD